MLIELKNIIVNYGKAEALKDISLNLDDGEIVTIVGANGAGKTTTLRAISGLIRPAAGEIFYEGQNISRMKPNDIVGLGIGHIPAGRQIFGPMSVLDNLKVGAHTRNGKKDVNADLERMYTHFPILKDRNNQLAGSLSGGQQQMLAIARAMMSSPRVLLMDEPSIGLSPILVAEVRDIIENINRGGISILLVEQNARMALKLSNRAYILQVGKIIMEGKASELVNDETVKRAYLGGK